MYALTFCAEDTTCRSCGERQPPGIIGWCFLKPPGALCDTCLMERDSDLGAVLILLHLARDVGAAEGEEGNPSEMERVLFLHTYCRVYELVASNRWPRRTYVLKELQEIMDRMEKMHEHIDA